MGFEGSNENSPRPKGPLLQAQIVCGAAESAKFIKHFLPKPCSMLTHRNLAAMFGAL